MSVSRFTGLWDTTRIFLREGSWLVMSRMYRFLGANSGESDFLRSRASLFYILSSIVGPVSLFVVRDRVIRDYPARFSNYDRFIRIAATSMSGGDPSIALRRCRQRPKVTVTLRSCDWNSYDRPKFRVDIGFDYCSSYIGDWSTYRSLGPLSFLTSVLGLLVGSS